MKGCLHVAAQIAAGLLAIAFVITLPLSLVAFNIGRIAFSPERMAALLNDTIAETGGLRQFVLDSLTSAPAPSPGEGSLDLSRALRFLTPQDRQVLGEELTPPGWAREQMRVV